MSRADVAQAMPHPHPRNCRFWVSDACLTNRRLQVQQPVPLSPWICALWASKARDHQHTQPSLYKKMQLINSTGKKKKKKCKDWGQKYESQKTTSVSNREPSKTQFSVSVIATVPKGRVNKMTEMSNCKFKKAREVEQRAGENALHAQGPGFSSQHYRDLGRVNS